MPFSVNLQKTCVNLKHPNISMNIFHNVFYTFPRGTDKENLFKIQELLCLVIISFFIVTLMVDSGVILCGETRC